LFVLLFHAYRFAASGYSSAKLKVSRSSFNGVIFRPVTRGAKPPYKHFRHLWKKCVGYCLKVLDIVLKIWSTFRTPLAPPGVPSWLRAW